MESLFLNAKRGVESAVQLVGCLVKMPEAGGWRDGSAVKSIACSSKGPEFNSQQPHGGPQPSVLRSGALFWLTAYKINK